MASHLSCIQVMVLRSYGSVSIDAVRSRMPRRKLYFWLKSLPNLFCTKTSAEVSFV